MTLPMASGLPSNYMNQQYWQYLAQLMQQQQQMQQTQMQNIYAGQAQAAQRMQQPTALTQTPDFVCNATPPSMVNKVGDGKDDGSIGFGSALKNIGKGAVKFFTGMVCDDKGNFSLGRTLTTVAVAAGAVALTVATGGAAAPFLVAGGVALSGAQVAKGAYNAATAKTDAEAETAWQDIGSGATGVGLSFVGAKGALKSSGAVTEATASNYSGVSGAFKATGKCFTESARMTKAGYNNLRADFSGTIANAKDVGLGNLKAKFNNDNATGFFQEKALSKYDRNIAKLENKIAGLDATKDAAKIAKLNQELRINNFFKNKLVNKLGEMDRLAPDQYESVIAQSKNKLANYKKYIKDNPDKTKSAIRKNALKAMENELKTLEQYQKVAAAKYKMGNIENKKLVELYTKDINKLQAKLKVETDALKQIDLKTEIAKLENNLNVFKATNKIDVPTFGENIAFSRAKYITPGIKELKTNKLWTGTGAINNAFQPAIKVNAPNPDQLLSQGYTEEQYAQLMAQLQNPGPNELAALNGAGGYPQPQMNFSNSLYNTMPPTGSPLGFEDLYQSPYPQMF